MARPVEPTPQEVADKIRQENISWGGAIVLLILLAGIVAHGV